MDGLTREVAEETGIQSSSAWTGPVYEVEAVAEGLGWTLRAEIHRAVQLATGELVVDDPDGIVVDARFVPFVAAAGYLDDCASLGRVSRSAPGWWSGGRRDGPTATGWTGLTPGSITVVKV